MDSKPSLFSPMLSRWPHFFHWYRTADRFSVYIYYNISCVEISAFKAQSMASSPPSTYQTIYPTPSSSATTLYHPTLSRNPPASLYVSWLDLSITYKVYQNFKVPSYLHRSINYSVLKLPYSIGPPTLTATELRNWPLNNFRWKSFFSMLDDSQYNLQST